MRQTISSPRRPRHHYSVVFIDSFQDRPSDKHRIFLTEAFVAAVKDAYPKVGQTAQPSRIVQLVARKLKRNRNLGTGWTDEDVKHALDYLAEQDEITLPHVED